MHHHTGHNGVKYATLDKQICRLNSLCVRE
jgi:hypothetical protein